MSGTRLQWRGKVRQITSERSAIVQKWKECGHPWYVTYREGKEIGPTGKLRERGLRKRLSLLVGREPVDFADAKAEARRAILAWKDGRDASALLPSDAPTLTMLLDAYKARQGAALRDIKNQEASILNTVVTGRKFGEWRAAEITRQMIEAFRRQRPTIAGNRNLALLRALFNWAVLGELLSATPFKVGTVAAVKLVREEPRTRRLEPGEDVQLLIHAGRLKDVITAALETGCRQGELLSLQWRQILAREVFLPAGKTKAKKTRRVPISSVLSEVLAARRNDPAGEPLPGGAYVFGDALGRRAKNIREAWAKAVLKAHGMAPMTDPATGRLTAACRAQFKSIDLHFHDLRREAGSRWMDAGVPLSVIQKWLGHANISQTSTYLAATAGGDADAMQRYERAAGRLPQVVASAGSDGPQPASSNSLTIENAQSIAITPEPAGVVH